MEKAKVITSDNVVDIITPYYGMDIDHIFINGRKIDMKALHNIVFDVTAGEVCKYTLEYYPVKFGR